MANTYDLIQRVTVGAGGQATIDFSSIPQTYTDLYIRASLRGDTGALAVAVLVNFNGASTATSRYIAGTGSVAQAGTGQNYFGDYNAANNLAGVFGTGEFYLPSYTSGAAKTYFTKSVSEDNVVTAYQELWAGYWSGTAAINQITLYPSPGSFVQYSTAYLYGVKRS